MTSQEGGKGMPKQSNRTDEGGHPCALRNLRRPPMESCYPSSFHQKDDNRDDDRRPAKEITPLHPRSRKREALVAAMTRVDGRVKRSDLG